MSTKTRLWIGISLLLATIGAVTFVGIALLANLAGGSPGVATLLAGGTSLLTTSLAGALLATLEISGDFAGRLGVSHHVIGAGATGDPLRVETRVRARSSTRLEQAAIAGARGGVLFSIGVLFAEIAKLLAAWCAYSRTATSLLTVIAACGAIAVGAIWLAGSRTRRMRYAARVAADIADVAPGIDERFVADAIDREDWISVARVVALAVAGQPR